MLYTIGRPSLIHLDIPKNDTADNSKMEGASWIIPFKKFSRLRVISDTNTVKCHNYGTFTVFTGGGRLQVTRNHLVLSRLVV